MNSPGHGHHLIPLIVLFIGILTRSFRKLFQIQTRKIQNKSMPLCPVEEVVCWGDCWLVLARLMLTSVPQWESVSLSILSFFWCVWHITMALRSVHMNKHEKTPGHSPRFTCCHPGHQDPQSIYLILYQTTNSKSAHFLCDFFSIGDKISYMEYTSLAAEPGTRCFMYWLVPSGHFFYLWDKTSSVMPYSSRVKRTETKLRPGVGSFHQNIQEQITQEGILTYIKCLIHTPCILEGLIYTSNNIFVRFVFRKEILNGDHSWNKYVS